MSFMDYLYSKALTLCFLGLGALTALVCFSFAQTALPLILVALTFFLLLVALWIVCDFLRCRRRLQKLNEQIGALEEKYLLGELISPPQNTVEQAYYAVLKTVSHAAITAVEEERRAKDAYCDYVESWIHEIKTPLTACSLILANGGDSRKLRRELKRADNLTETILYFARLRSAEKDRQISRMQVAPLIDEAVKSQMELLTAAGIAIDVQGDFSLDTDSKALCFILKQLLVNCAKYCPGSRVKILAENRTLTVEDNGIGIPDQELRRVWDRGFTGSNGRKAGNSTGMGLYLVRALCDQLKISLDISSAVGQFTKIILVFPS